MVKFKKLIPVAAICLLLATIVGGSCTVDSPPASNPSLGEIFDPSGNPFAHRFSDVTDLRTATYIVAASDSVHKYEADYFCDGTNDGSIAQLDSTSVNFGADDIIFWINIEAGTLALTGGDSVEVKILHEAAEGDNCATNAYFRTVTIEYV